MNIFDKQPFQKIFLGKHLAQARINFKLSQEALAEAIGTTARSISRWEHNQAFPQKYYRERLCEVLQCTPEELFGASNEEQWIVSQSIPLWHVPYPRNPYFTGREAILRQLHEELHAKHQVALTQSYVVCGIGGIGKTQTALEYVYRFRRDYQALLWVRAETHETLMSDYRALAYLFQLSEKESSDQNFLREAVKRWFQNHIGWLLVFDNVEDLELLNGMLPDTSQGHVLITKRSQIMGALGSHINLQKMEVREGMLFLLKRARFLRPGHLLEAAPLSLLTQAKAIVDLLDGFPLALDQAGAYIEETTCSLSDYLDRYTTQRAILLNNRGTVSSHHPASVTTTLSLSFQQVERIFPPAAELLRLCAFLHAEAIPEAFIIQAEGALGPVLHSLSVNPLLWDAAVKVLRQFSLLHREPELRTLSIHRLLQVIIQDGMNEDERKQWIKWIIQAMLQIFPDYRNIMSYDIGRQSSYQWYLPHVLACATSIKEWDITSLEAGELLYRVGNYLQFWGDYPQAVLLLLQALRLTEKLLGTEHTTVALYLNELAHVYRNVMQHTQSEACFMRSLAIREKVKGPNHPEVADSLLGLSCLFIQRGKYAQAEAFAQRALAIEEQVSGSSHHKIAIILNALGESCILQSKYVQAEQLLIRAMKTYEKTLSKDHLLLAPCLKNLGYLYYTQKHYTKATIFYQKTLYIYEQRLGPYHPYMANALKRLGNISFVDKRYQEAKGFYRRAFMIYKKLSVPDYFHAAYTLIDLGEVYLAQDCQHLVKRCLQRALTMLEQKIQIDQGDHQDLVRCFLFVGNHLATQGELVRAQSYYQRALVVGEQLLGSDHLLIEHCRSSLKELCAEGIPSPLSII